MNQPDRYDQFILKGAKVEYKADTKLENAGTFTFQAEDHTLGNLMRMQLHTDPCIVFAGYRVPHPLENKMVVKVQTNGQCTPEAAVTHALKDLEQEWIHLKDQFETGVRKMKEDAYMGH